MSITYKVCKCRNPKNPDADFFKGTSVNTGTYDFDDLADGLAEDIAESTTVTKADAMAVLGAIRPKIKKELLNGQRVVLTDLGSFHISIQGKCYPAEVMAQKEFSPSSMVKGHRIVFRPEAKLKKEIAKDFSLKRISSEAMA